jgi:high-affinity nickel permease
MKLFDLAFVLILSNAFFLGLRHGVDWDHLAAISDLVSTSSTETGAETGAPGTDEDSARSSRQTIKSMSLTFYYGLGHSLMVLLLSLAALTASAQVPEGWSTKAEGIVGVTLIIFGVYVAWRLKTVIQDGAPPRFTSRLTFLSMIFHKATAFFHGHAHVKSGKVANIAAGPKSALTLGILHGLGAETGSQILIIGAVGTSGNILDACGLLLSFIIGFLMSNAAVALAFSTGLNKSTKYKPVYIGACSMTALFSIATGWLFLSGQAEKLPTL